MARLVSPEPNRAATEGFDLVCTQAVANGMQARCVCATQNPIVQRFVGDPGLLQLAFGILVSIETQFGAVSPCDTRAHAKRLTPCR